MISSMFGRLSSAFTRTTLSLARPLSLLAFGCGMAVAQATDANITQDVSSAPVATLAQKYEVAFRFDQDLQRLAAERDATDPTSGSLRTLLSQRIGISESELAPFHAAARRFVREEKFLSYRIHADMVADQNTHPSSRQISPVVRSVIDGLLAGVDRDAETEIAAMHVKLTPAQTKKLDSAIEDLYNGVHVILTRKQGSAPKTAASGAEEQPSTKTAQEPVKAEDEAAEPAYCAPPPPPANCTTPESASFMMVFSPDGLTVTANFTTTITAADVANQCYPVANLVFDQDGSPFPVQRADGPLGTATVTSTLAEPVNVGSKYSLDSSALALSCMNDNDDSACGQLLVLSTAFTTGVPTVTNAPFSGEIGANGSISLYGNDLGGPPGNTPTVNAASGSGLSLTVSGPTNYSAGGASDLSASEQDLGYSIASATTPTTTSFTLTSAWGTSSPITFNIECGQPSLLNVTPSSWVAGVATAVQVVGTNFCTGMTGTVTLQDGTVFGVPGVVVNGSANASFTVTPSSSIVAQPGVLTLTNTNGFSANYQINITSAPSSGNLYFIDPYLLPNVNATSSTVDPNAVISAIQSGANVMALGAVADGYSNFIAVYASPGNGDVTFTSTANLALVQTFDPNFLTDSAPGTVAPNGASTIVPAAQLIASNGLYYALVLVRTPYPKVIADISGSSQVRTISVSQAASSTTGPTTGSNTIMLWQKPVLLVHGLWANQSSFSNIQPYLQTALPNQIPNSIVAICYSRFIPYDAASDPYFGTTNDPYNNTPLNNCEDTSANKIDAAIKQIQQSLDQQNIVSGQIDYIGHSMGGLAGRNYSNLPSSTNPGISYASYRNMNQGAFSQAVTIDTPEQGSGLANFLVNNINSSVGAYTVAQYPAAVAVYQAACSFKGQTTSSNLQECFGYIGQPINWPGSGPNSGAVGSLQIGGAAGSSIGNTGDFRKSTYHTIVASVYPSSQPVPSLLRDTLQSFATAVSDSATTLSEYLGSTSYGDDVIVTLESQVWPLTPTTFFQAPSGGQPFEPVEHTATVPNLSPVITGILGDSDNNILAWNPLDGELLCKLISSGTQPCGPGYQTQVVSGGGATANSAQAAQPSSPAVQKPSTTKPQVILRLDNSRITLVQPTATFRLAEPAEITLKVNTPGVNTVETEQCVPRPTRNECTGSLEGSRQKVPILTRADGSQYIRIIPITLRKADLIVRAAYAGGVYTEATVHLHVQPSLLPAQQIIVTADGTSGRHARLVLLDMEMEKRHTASVVVPLVRYPTLLEPINIAAENVTFSVRATPGDPVISLDPKTGIIRPLHIGHALLITSYANVSARSCVIVTEHDLDTAKMTDCHDLLKDGESLSR